MKQNNLNQTDIVRIRFVNIARRKFPSAVSEMKPMPRRQSRTVAGDCTQLRERLSDEVTHGTVSRGAGAPTISMPSITPRVSPSNLYTGQFMGLF